MELPFSSFVGTSYRKTLKGVTEYSAFFFTEPKKIDKDVWRPHPDQPGYWQPNPLNNEGGTIEAKLKGLPGLPYALVYTILGIKPGYNVAIPYLNIVKAGAFVWLPDGQKTHAPGCEVVTAEEFYSLLEATL